MNKCQSVLLLKHVWSQIICVRLSLCFMTFCWFWQKGVNSWRGVCVCVNVWFLTTPGQFGVFSPLRLEPSPGRQPSFIIELVLKASLRASEWMCVSVGAQVMSFLTAVERRCYCSAPLMKASPPPSTLTFLPPPSSQLLTSPPYKLFLSQLQQVTLWALVWLTQ